MPNKIAILASGSGTNAENIANHFKNSDIAKVAFVLTDRRDAGVSKRMEPLGIDTYFVPAKIWKQEPEKIVNFLKRNDADIIVLAGFLRYVAPEILNAFPGRVLNIHPSLLPKFGGKGMWGHKVHEAVIEAGETKSGATVHLVSEVMDGGEIILQEEVDITPADTSDTLESKVHQAEYALYPKAIEKLISTFHSTPQQECPPSPSREELNTQWAETLGVKPVENIESAAPTPLQTAPPPYTPQQASDTPMQQPLRQMPDNYLIWCVIFIVFCCAPAAIVALIYSLQVSSKWYADDVAGAEKASKMTQRWLKASFAIGVVEATFLIPLWFIAAM